MERESKKERGYVESSAVHTCMLTCGTNLLNTRGFPKAPVFFYRFEFLEELTENEFGKHRRKWGRPREWIRRRDESGKLSCAWSEEERIVSHNPLPHGI